MKKITLLLFFMVSFVYAQNFSDHIIDDTNPDALSTHIVDIDGDGDLDIIASFFNDPSQTEGSLNWYENDGSQNYTLHIVDTDINGAYSVAPADINGDGYIDILLSAAFENTLYVYFSNGDSPTTFAAKFVLDSSATLTDYSAAADFDGDNIADALSANYSGNEVAWYKFTPPSTVVKHVVDSASTEPSTAETGDMDNDGDMDIVVAGNDEIVWYENDGTGSFTEHSIPASSGFTGSVTAYMSDVNGDGNMDIIGSASTLDEVAWFENDGAENFTKHIVATGVDYASFAQAVDVNSDGHMDIVASATESDELFWFENDGTSMSFISHSIGIHPLGDSFAIDTADIDADGDMDIALTSPGPNILRWLENDLIGVPSNDLCGNAITLECGNSYEGATTSATETDEETGNCGTTQGAAGVWFKYVGDDSDVTLDLCGSDFDTKIQVWSGACGSLACVGGNDDSPNDHCAADLNQSLLTFGADLGTDYYVYVYGYGTNTGNYDVEVSCVPYPDCPNLTNILADNFTAPNNADLSWDAAAGATGYNWEIQPQGTAQGDAAMVDSGSPTTNTATATMLVDTLPYTLYVQSDCGGGALGYWHSFDFTFVLPASNDECSDAITLNCGDNLTAQTTIGATGGSSTSCQGSIGNDIWYKYVGDGARVTIEVNSETVNEEAQIDVYASTDGTCAGFTPGTCDGTLVQSGGGLNPYTATFDSLVGTTYYIAVGNWINGSPDIVFDLNVSCLTCYEPIAMTESNKTETNLDLGWIAGSTETMWEIVYDVAPYTQPGDGDATGEPNYAHIDTTPSLSLSGLTPGTSYDVYYRSHCGGTDYSAWSMYTFYTGYCFPEVTTSPLTFIDAFITANATINVSNIATGFSTNNYGDYYDTMNVALKADESFDFNVQIAGGSVGCAIWVDWNNDLIFDVATEVVFQNGSFDSGPFTGTITVPTATADGDYRMRVMIDYNDNIIEDDACTFNGDRGEVEDYKITVDSTLAIGSLETVGFNYYPNPVNDMLTVTANETITNLIFYNMLGQEVKNVNLSSLNAKINIATLTDGTYFVKAIVNTKVGTFKIIKK